MNKEIDYVKIELKKHFNSVVNVNICSLNKNINHLQNLCNSLETPKIVIATEVWQPRNTNLKGYQPPVLRVRCEKRGGGIGIFVREKTPYAIEHKISNIKFKFIETIAIIIKEKYNEYVAIGVYRPPNSNIKQALEEFKILLRQAKETKLPFLVSGDLNIDISRKNHITNEYLDIIQYHQCSQLIESPTRITHKSSTIIDHIITSNEIIAESAVINATVSDHLPTILYWKVKNSKNSHTFQTFQTFSKEKIDLKKLEQKLLNRETINYENMNANSSFDAFHTIVTETIQECSSKFKAKYSPRTVWISEKALKSKIEMDKKRKIFLRQNTLQNETEYKSSKTQYNRQLRYDKKVHYQNKILEANGNPHKIWQIINEVLNRKQKQQLRSEIIDNEGNLTSDENKISNSFNTFYKDIALEIVRNIPKSNQPYEYYLSKMKQPENSFELKEVDSYSVYKTMMNISSKKSKGPYGISNYILKKIAPFVFKDLTTCINKSFKEKTFPETLKVSKIVPLFKKGDSTDMNNWRPICQISPFSKVYEKLYLQQLNEHYETNRIIDKNQFGFMEKHNVTQPLIIIKDYIERNLNLKNEVVLIGIDLTKAFDLINTNGILQNKLLYLFKNQESINWLSSYFKNRHQYTKWQESLSETVKCNNYSIVQGSAQGPKTFISFINDLPKVSDFLTILFADDTSLLMAHKDPKKLQIEINKELIKINDYFNANGLSLNINKTSFLHFTSKANKTILELKIGNETIKEESSLKFLGVTLDNNLKFKTHFQNVVDKLRKGLNGLILSKNILTYESKFAIYHSLFHCHLSYCPIVWLTNLTLKEKKILGTMQKRQ